MISSKINEPNRVLIKQREVILRKHYEKLKEIERSEKRNDYSFKPSPNIKKSPFNTDRKIEINRENKILISKLNNIFQRKPENFRTPSSSQKSLNFQNRKKLASKINEENFRIAERLQKKKPLIHKKKFDEDFLLHLKYKNQLSKEKLMKYQELFWGKVHRSTTQNSVTPTERYEESPTFKFEKYPENTYKSRTPVLPTALPSQKAELNSSSGSSSDYIFG